RAQIAQDLKDGKLEEQWVTIEVTENAPSLFDAMPGMNMDNANGMQDMLSNLMPKKTKKRKGQVKDARGLLKQAEAIKLIDTDTLSSEANHRAEEAGIIFIDEIDKVASKGSTSAEVSREGV